MTHSELPHHPIQPLVRDSYGVIRYRQNAIVRYLLDHGGTDLNHIAMMPFSTADREQFAMLIGYSVSGASELEYMYPDTLHASDLMAEALREGRTLDQKDARIAALEARITSMRTYLEKIRAVTSEFHDLQPGDLDP